MLGKHVDDKKHASMEHMSILTDMQAPAMEISTHR